VAVKTSARECAPGEALCGEAGLDPCESTGPNVILGTEGPDTLTGTAGDDVICGFGGDDAINGMGGNDKIFGGFGNDTLDGGAGDDALDGGGGDDQIRGGDRNDLLLGGIGNDTLAGDGGADLLRGFDGNDRLDGGDGIDSLNGDAGDDQLTGAAGDDNVTGGDGLDTQLGETGTDSCLSVETMTSCLVVSEPSKVAPTVFTVTSPDPRLAGLSVAVETSGGATAANLELKPVDLTGSYQSLVAGVVVDIQLTAPNESLKTATITLPVAATSTLDRVLVYTRRDDRDAWRVVMDGVVADENRHAFVITTTQLGQWAVFSKP
jgi:RTX calcium-binding nonapeptide repeat (4 copies)